MIYEIENIFCQVDKNGKIVKIVATEHPVTEKADRDANVLPLVGLLPLVEPVVKLISEIVSVVSASGKLKKIKKLVETPEFQSLTDSQKWVLVSAIL